MITETINAIPEHATYREVERVFGIPPETTKRLIARHQVRAVKVYHRILVDLSSLRAYLAALPVIENDDRAARHAQMGEAVSPRP